jgi:Arylsulfotransferase (ASST)
MRRLSAAPAARGLRRLDRSGPAGRSRSARAPRYDTARLSEMEVPALQIGWKWDVLVGLTLPRAKSSWLVALNARGKPVWWQRTSRPVLQNQILPDGTVVWARSFRDGYGVDPRMAEEVHALSGRRLRLIRTHGTITDGHELQVVPGGDTYLDSYSIRDDVDLSRFGGRPHGSVADAEVQELSPGGRVLWRWNSRGHIRLAETGRWWHHSVAYNPHIVDGRKTYDPVHINSIAPHGRTIVISSRNTDAVYAISRRTGQILWKLGGTQTPRSLRVTGDPNSPELFGGQHDARLYPNGLLSVYDDATHRARPPRAAFYRIDPKDGTAAFVGQLTDPLVKRSHCCGSVRPFEGGWLVDWGDNPLVTGFDRHGQIAFRIHLAVSSYRAVPVPPSVGAATLRHTMNWAN